MNRHLLSSADLSRDDVETILADRRVDARRAEARRQEDPDPARPNHHQPLLRGLHPHPQLVRDRRQVDVRRHHQHHRQGLLDEQGRVACATPSATIDAMAVDALVIRHHASGACHQVAQWVDASVINAGDGTHEHPTQALLDAYALRNRIGDLDGRHVAIVGDLTHSRVFRSNVITLGRLGAHVTVVAPPTLMPSGIADWSKTDGFATSLGPRRGARGRRHARSGRRRDDAARPARADERRVLPDGPRVHRHLRPHPRPYASAHRREPATSPCFTRVR